MNADKPILTPIILLVVIASAAAAQESVADLRCTFDQAVTFDSDTGAPYASSDTLHLVFTDFRDDGTAVMVANVGSARVEVRGGTGVFTIFETTGNGTIQVTAVDTTVEYDRGFRAVHSRHTLGIPSQAYGFCKWSL